MTAALAAPAGQHLGHVAAPRRGDDDAASARGTPPSVRVAAPRRGDDDSAHGFDDLDCRLLPLVGAMMTGPDARKLWLVAFALLPLVGAMMTRWIVAVRMVSEGVLLVAAPRRGDDDVIQVSLCEAPPTCCCPS